MNTVTTMSRKMGLRRYALVSTLAFIGMAWCWGVKARGC